MNTLFKRGLAMVLAMVLCLGLASGVTVSAEEADRWVKITEAPADWSGTYLIVYEGEDRTVAFDAGLAKADAEGNHVAVTIADGVITGDYSANAVTIAAVEGGYSILLANGQYMGNDTNKNTLTTGNTALVNTIALDAEQGVLIAGDAGATLRFNNAASNGNRFRYYKSTSYANQQPVALYKLTEAQVEVDPVAEILNGYYVIVENQMGTEVETCAIEFIPASKGATEGTCVISCTGDAFLDRSYPYYYDAETQTVMVTEDGIVTGISVKPLTMEATLNLKISWGNYGKLIKAERPTLTEGDNTIDISGTPRKSYVFTAPVAGTYTLTVTENAEVCDVYQNYMDIVSLPASFTLEAGETFAVNFASSDYANYTVTVNVALDAPVVEPPVVTPTTPQEILDAAFALADGETLEGTYTLTGVVTKITDMTSYGDRHVNFTVLDKDMYAYCLKGELIADVKVGDTITVTGTIKNYKGTIEFDRGCTLDALVPGETEQPPVEDNDPTPDTELSIKDAIALGAGKDHNTYTEGKYYVTGVITEVYNTQYGNMKITDAEGNILTIYGTYSADGADRYDAMAVQPQVGDTVKIYGIVGQYKDAPQIKNGWIVEHTPAGEEPPVDDNPSSGDNSAVFFLMALMSVSLAAVVVLGKKVIRK